MLMLNEKKLRVIDKILFEHGVTSPVVWRFVDYRYNNNPLLEEILSTNETLNLGIDNSTIVVVWNSNELLLVHDEDIYMNVPDKSLDDVLMKLSTLGNIDWGNVVFVSDKDDLKYKQYTMRSLAANIGTDSSMYLWGIGKYLFEKSQSSKSDSSGTNSLLEVIDTELYNMGINGKVKWKFIRTNATFMKSLIGASVLNVAKSSFVYVDGKFFVIIVRTTQRNEVLGVEIYSTNDIKPSNVINKYAFKDGNSTFANLVNKLNTLYGLSFDNNYKVSINSLPDEQQRVVKQNHKNYDKIVAVSVD